MTYKRTAINQEAGYKTREDGNDIYIDGYFAVFGAKYQLWADNFETIDPGAFDLEADKDVRALTNHDTTLVLGRTTAGTLTLSQDDNGLFGSIRINRSDQDAVNLYERVKRGDVTQCSFGFDILDEEMIRPETGGPIEWHIKRVKLYEVSVCTFPAYDETGVKAREKELEEMRGRLVQAWKERVADKLKGGKADA